MASTHCTGLGPLKHDLTGLEVNHAADWDYSTFSLDIPMNDYSLEEFLQFPIDQGEPIASAQAVETPLSDSSAPEPSSFGFYSNPRELDQLLIPPNISMGSNQFPSASIDMGLPKTQGDNLMPVSDTKVQPRRRIDPMAWEEKRDIIERLYHDNSLSDTIKIMKAEHGFSASYVLTGLFVFRNVNLTYMQGESI